MIGFLRKLLAPRNTIADCEHEWDVVGTALSDVSLEVQCRKCAWLGTVPDPTEDEWSDAFGAIENPKPWSHPERVEPAKEHWAFPSSG